MEVSAAISFGIGIAGFVAGILWKVVDLSVKFGKLTSQVERVQDREKEDRDKMSQKFGELFTRMGNNESALAQLNQSITNLAILINKVEDNISKVEAKVDKIMAKITV